MKLLPRLWVVLLLAQPQHPSLGQDATSVDAGRLLFRFNRAPWEDVLQWLAESADLAIHVGDLPTGSFTYSDSRSYTPDEAIDRVNLFLIPRGYSMVRSGRLLAVISLNDEVSLRQLDAMAESVNPEDLVERSDHLLVKCLFPLRGVEPEIAIQELSTLQLVREPVILQQSAQVAVIDTVGKLRTVQQILSRLAERTVITGPVTRFEIGTADVEELLSLIRPHVGLAASANSGTDISLSVDRPGRQILVSGAPENVAKVAEIIKLAQSESKNAAEPFQFRTHTLDSADIEMVTNVLQTLLVAEDVRLSADRNSNQLAVLASPDVHERVARTIADLSHDALEFRAIPVHSVDLHYAATIVRQMFSRGEGTADPVGSSAAARQPTIDVDWLNCRLFVRARSHQIQQIEEVLDELQSPSTVSADGGNSRVRVLPYVGERGRRILDAARQFWPHDEELQILTPLGNEQPGTIEREINREPAAGSEHHGKPEFDRWIPLRRTDSRAISQVTAFLPSEPDAGKTNGSIRVQLTPRGLLVHSDDPDAVQRFEEHVRLIAGPTGATPMRLAVFYLKHATVDNASRLLKRLLVAEAESSPIPKVLESPKGVTSETLTELGVSAHTTSERWSVGTATIIPDQRLNRVFVYATSDQLLDIESHLEVIDRESSIAAAVKTFGSPHVIELENARAEQVAGIIRDAYAGRIAATAEERRQAAEQLRRQPPGDRNSAERAATQAQLAEETGQLPQMTLSVDTQGNALIVTAPVQLAREVRTLALRIDEQGQSTIRVVPIRSAATLQAYQTLTNMLGGSIRSRAPVQPADNRSSGTPIE
jgi:type II secretory pathway component GspD/PulD (secretin)